LWRLNDGKNFRLDSIPDVGKGIAGCGETVPEMIQVGVDGEFVVRGPISEMKTAGDGKVGLLVNIVPRVW